jgi:hypothetical protein
MHSGKLIFSQIMNHLPLKEFHRCVDRYQGHHKVQSFSCLDQFLCLAFAQLTYRESLRDIEACLTAQLAPCCLAPSSMKWNAATFATAASACALVLAWG